VTTISIRLVATTEHPISSNDICHSADDHTAIENLITYYGADYPGLFPTTPRDGHELFDMSHIDECDDDLDLFCYVPGITHIAHDND
jgi:hypothetical protein